MHLSIREVVLLRLGPSPKSCAPGGPLLARPSQGQYGRRAPQNGMNHEWRANIVGPYRTTSMNFLNPGAVVQHPKQPSRVRTGCLVLYLPAKPDLLSWSGGRC